MYLQVALSPQQQDRNTPVKFSMWRTRMLVSWRTFLNWVVLHAAAGAHPSAVEEPSISGSDPPFKECPAESCQHVHAARLSACLCQQLSGALREPRVLEQIWGRSCLSLQAETLSTLVAAFCSVPAQERLWPEIWTVCHCVCGIQCGSVCSERSWVGVEFQTGWVLCVSCWKISAAHRILLLPYFPHDDRKTSLSRVLCLIFLFVFCL